MPLVNVFYGAYGTDSVLADPPGVTARSAIPCHAPLTPVHFSEGTFTSVRTPRKTASPLVTRFEYLLSTCLSARMACYGACGPTWSYSSLCHALPRPAYRLCIPRRALYVRLDTAQYRIIRLFCKVRRRLRTCFGMLVNSPPCTRGPSRRPTRRDGTLSDATGNEPDLLNSFTVSCVLTTWDFWVAVLRPRPKGAYSFHGDSGVAVWIPNMNNKGPQGSLRALTGLL